MPCGRFFPSYFFPSTPLPGPRRLPLEPMRGMGKPAIGASIIAALSLAPTRCGERERKSEGERAMRSLPRPAH